jgi:fucose 4-O-acetylase-like acetyltransferase
MRNVAWAGILMIGCGLSLRSMPHTLPGSVNFYTTSPLYIWIRIGCVLIICSLLYRLETERKWIPKLIQAAGQESLLVYGMHLWLIFGVLRGRLFGRTLGLQSGYLGCFFISIVIVMLMLFLAGYYHAIKSKYPKRTRYAQAIIVILMFAVFMLS